MVTLCYVTGPVSEPCEGDIVTGRVKQVLPGHALLVSTPHGTGRIDITNISDTFVEDPLKQMKTSSFLRLDLCFGGSCTCLPIGAGAGVHIYNTSYNF